MATNVTRYGEILPVFNEPRQMIGYAAHMNGTQLVIEQLVDTIDISTLVQQAGGVLTIDDVVYPTQSANSRVLVLWVSIGSTVGIVHGSGILTQTGMNLQYSDSGTLELIYTGAVWLQV